MRWTIEKAFTRWEREGLLNGEQIARLRDSLDRGESSRLIRIFAVLGAVLVGLGAILFVGSNWAHMSPPARVLVLLASYGIVVAAGSGLARHNLPNVTEAVWLLATVLVGANIFLLAQIFNHSLTFWQGPFMWMVGAVAMGWACQSRFQAAVAIPLGVLALGWYGAGEGRLIDHQMLFLFEDEGLRPVIHILGLGLIAAAVLVPRLQQWRFAAGALMGWGLTLFLIPLIIATAGVTVATTLFGFSGSAKQWVVLISAVVLVGLALIQGRFRSDSGRVLLAIAAGFSIVLVLPLTASPWIGWSAGVWHPLFGLYVIGLAAVALLAISVGIRAHNRQLVNAGIATAAVLIVIQYFSWTFLLLDRALVFVAGGLLILALSVAMERKRRQILLQMREVEAHR